MGADMDDNLSKVEQFKLLIETGPSTPMGTLLRKFWHPIAVSEKLEKGKAQALRVLGEDLTLYRGEGGRPYLIGGRCAHRCTVLHTGVIQGEQIRCMYHGWRYDGTGLCTDIPAEKQPRSRPITIAGYPVHEYSGVVFAYLGEQPVPTFDLPRKHILEEKGRSTLVYKSVWDCNWFQHVENSLDAVHVSFAHLWGSVGQDLLLCPPTRHAQSAPLTGRLSKPPGTLYGRAADVCRVPDIWVRRGKGIVSGPPCARPR